MRDTLQETKASRKIDHTILPSLMRKGNGTENILSLLGSVFCAGGPLNLASTDLRGTGGKSSRVLVDLPKYPWDHSVTYWHESRISADYRLRKRPKHHLLGVPSLDFDPLQPSWRHIIRSSELPWLEGHVIQSDVLYPAGGFLAAALQALNEH